MASNVYRYNDFGPAPIRKWVWRAVLVSFLFHLLLGAVLYNTQVRHFGDPYYEQLVPRSFKLDRVEIDPRSLDRSDPIPLDEITEILNAEPVEVEVPPEEMDIIEEEIRATPTAPDLEMERFAEEFIPERPDSPASLDELERAAEESLVAELNGLAEQLFDDVPVSPARPLMDLPQMTLPQEEVELPGSPLGDLGGERLPATEPPQGFSDLDDLLRQAGPIPADTGPILMPTDLLFDYDSYELRSRAVESLRKLGQLISDNPDSHFTIEGHTDSFGPADYNMELSELRALAVKQWLVEEAGVSPDQINTIGLGQTQLIVTEGDIEEQAINRRVEIVIRTRRGGGPRP